MTYEIELKMDERCNLRDYTKFIRSLYDILDSNQRGLDDWVQYDCSGNVELHRVTIGAIRKFLMMMVSLRSIDDRDVQILSISDDERSWIPDGQGHKKLIEVLFDAKQSKIDGFWSYSTDVTEEQVWRRFKDAMKVRY